MSAYVVDTYHIDVLVDYAYERPIRAGFGSWKLSYFWKGERHDLPDSKDETGQILLDQNVRSVNFHYSDDQEYETYKHTRRITPYVKFTPEQIINACDCLIYQSCETDDYYKTRAYALLNAIREKAIDAVLDRVRDDLRWELTAPVVTPAVPMPKVEDNVVLPPARNPKAARLENIEIPHRRNSRYTAKHMSETESFNADVIKGKQVRIWGKYHNTTFDLTFKMGDTVTYDSYNLIYLGKIEGITDKTITIRPNRSEKTKRLPLYWFIWRNHNFDLERVNEQNYQTSLYI